MSKLIAYKSNFLIEASYRLSLQEQRFVLSCIAKINPKKDIPETLTIHASEFYMNFPDMGKENSERELKKAVDKLWDRSILVSSPEKTEEFRWVQSRVKYHKGEAKVTVSFSNEIKKYLTELQGQFTKVTLRNVSGLTSAYSIRIYEMCQQFITTGERTIFLDDLRSYLQVGDAHPTFKVFNRDVIKPAIKELNKKSNLKIDIIQQKKGRRITALSFVFREKEQMEMDI